ncbi:hypothetical protein HG531_000662 [Fusarium graminearum]|nr:hypothetical protein HG531_000662 [Fusarium graminearum]
MDFNFGHSAPSASGSASSSNWLGHGQRVAMPNSSPGVPNAMPEDDVSFAESYRPETSPLFNPIYVPRNNAAATAPPVGTSPGPAPTWPWQRDASTLDNTLNSDNFDLPDASPLPTKPTSHETVSTERPAEAQEAFSPQRAPLSPPEQPAGEETVVQQDTTEEIVRVESDIDTPAAEGSRVEAYEHSETIIQSSEKQPEGTPSQNERDNEVTTGADRVEETPTDAHMDLLSDAEKFVDGQKTPLQEQSNSPEPSSAPAAAPGKLRSALLSVGRGLMKRMSAPAVATSEQDDVQTGRAVSSQPEQQTEIGVSTPSLVVELKKMSNTEKASFTEVSDNEEEDVPAPSAKRGRPRKQSLADKTTTSVTKSARERRNIASAPASPAVKPTSVAKRARKSMPASTTVDETPKKRGRPRKSDAVATPAPPPSTTKRGRPRKSEATPIAVPSASKPLSARGRRVASASKAAVTPRRPATARTPKTVIGLQAAATPASTPKPRGRPPKNPKPTEEAEPEVEVPKRAGRTSQASNAAEDTPAKTTRAVKPRAVPSPAKRGRPPKNAASSPAPKTETQTATKRGRRAAAEPKEEAPVEAPKRRGHPAAKIEAPATEEPASEPKTRKRGRPVATEETLAEEPAPKRRGRAAKSALEEQHATAPKRRGRAAASEATGELVAEPATSKKRGAAKTASKTEDTISEPVAPKKRGRGAAAAKAVENVSAETTTKRGCRKRSAPEPEPEAESPEPAPTKSAKATSAKKPGRPAKATKEAVEESAPKRGKSARSKAAEPASVEEVPKPAKRGRGPAKKKAEPAAEAEAEAEKPKARGRPTKGKSRKGELPSTKNAETPTAKRGRGAAAKTTAAPAPTKVTKTGRAAQTGVRRGLRSRG